MARDSIAPDEVWVELRAEEAARARDFAWRIAVVAGAAAIAPLWLGELAWTRILMLAACALLVTLSVRLVVLARDERYHSGTFRTLGGACVVAFLCIQLYLGFFSAGTTTVVLGLTFLGTGDDRKFATPLFLGAILLYMVVTALFAFRLLPDPGLVTSASLTLAERTFFVLMVPIVYLVTVWQAVLTRRETRSAAVRMYEALHGIEQARHERELAIGRQIQQQMVPADNLIRASGAVVAGYSQPAEQCGGDWWTCRPLPDGRVLVVVGDVTGHGAGPALMTAIVGGACDATVSTLGDAFSCGRLLELLNRAVCQLGQGRLHMTCCALALDPKSRQVSFANAGHCFPYLVDGAQARVLKARGHALGNVHGATYRDEVLGMSDGEVLVAYSDGLTEHRDPSGAQYSTRRLRAEVAWRVALPAESLRDGILEDLRAFGGETPLEDDLTLVIVRLEPAAPGPGPLRS